MNIDEKRQFHGDRPPLADAELLLLPIAFDDAALLKALARDLSGAGINLAIASNQAIAPAPQTAARNQRRADALLAQARRTATRRVLAITDIDLYMPGLNFVFGMAEARAAVVSTHRLRTGADAASLEKRLLKEALHEIGHTFGLGHCDDPHCVMSFSNSLFEADRKSSRFCSACRGRLNSRRRR